jgi:hypothetical protein
VPETVSEPVLKSERRLVAFTLKLGVKVCQPKVVNQLVGQ